jgi:8-oxo-dGTP diphosphatase
MVEAPKTDVIQAAGGLVWRRGARDRELAVVRRERYGTEWTLPKGKLQAGESWEAAAVREAQEETGAVVEPGGFAGGFVYRADGRPKVALFWHMVLVRDGELTVQEEVKAVDWVTPGIAERRLTHALERALLAEALPSAPVP